MQRVLNASSASLAPQRRSVAGRIPTQSVGTMKFKEGAHGVRLLEINPRPSGGFGMACLSGADLALIAFRSFKGEAYAEPVIHFGLKVTEVGTPVVLA